MCAIIPIEFKPDEKEIVYEEENTSL
jgi:hypothetical protein